jgi:hypothetical protein
MARGKEFVSIKQIVSVFVFAETEQHSTAQHSTAQHSTAQHSTAQHSKRSDAHGVHEPFLRTPWLCCSSDRVLFVS